MHVLGRDAQAGRATQGNVPIEYGVTSALVAYTPADSHLENYRRFVPRRHYV